MFVFLKEEELASRETRTVQSRKSHEDLEGRAVRDHRRIREETNHASDGRKAEEPPQRERKVKKPVGKGRNG